MEGYLYLLLDLLTLSFPLLRSFEHKVHFRQYWRGLFSGILVMGLVFLPWDVAFTAAGVWGFNERYLIGPDLFGLPLEEWLFFLVVPYACVFIHEVLRYFVPRDVLGAAGRPIALLLALLFLSVGLVTHDRAYTATTLLGTALFL
ncbi:MAG: lycopene cyclase domain-containing protein, partial [Flavobacteriales bacterium]|nr:lycopene cyclase domain-containing protein [Flavobacteriales bacterium]